MENARADFHKVYKIKVYIFATCHSDPDLDSGTYAMAQLLILFVLAVSCGKSVAEKIRVNCNSGTRNISDLNEGDSYEIVSHRGFDNRKEYKNKDRCSFKFQVRSAKLSIYRPWFTISWCTVCP